MTSNSATRQDPEAAALWACYQFLLERRTARLAREQAQQGQDQQQRQQAPAGVGNGGNGEC